MPPLPDAERFTVLLDALVPLAGLSGYEDAVGGHMADTLAPAADAVWIDRLGNLIARFGTENAAHKVAVLAHMDTVGFMVKQADVSAGMLRLVPVGGVNLAALSGAAVDVWSYKQLGEVPRLPGIPGVIGVRSQHQARSGDMPSSVDDLYVQVDPGVAAQIRVTTPVTYMPQILRQGALYSSPYLDNRAGCAVLLGLGAWLADNRPRSDRTVYLIGTVQEETTCSGAFAALRAVQPHAAIVIDGTLSYDTPDTRTRGEVALGRGPVLTAYLYTSGLNGWHADPQLRAHLSALARARRIPLQEDAITGLMSDARAATWLGIPSVLVGIPMRGKHAPLETLHLRDLVQTAQLVAALLGEPYIPA